MLEQKGATVNRSMRACSVDGRPLECAVLTFEVPGYDPQALVVAQGKLDGVPARITCDVVPYKEPLTLRSPCSELLTLED